MQWCMASLLGNLASSAMAAFSFCLIFAYGFSFVESAAYLITKCHNCPVKNINKII